MNLFLTSVKASFVDTEPVCAIAELANISVVNRRIVLINDFIVSRYIKLYKKESSIVCQMFLIANVDKYKFIFFLKKC